jgi:TP901 family phage tail tape measure protein
MANPIRIVISAVDKFSSKFAQISKRIETVGQKLNDVGMKASIGLTVPIMAMGISTVNTAAQFEKSMNRAAVLTRATDSQFADLSKTARQLGRDTVFTAGEAADAMGFLAMSGFDTTQIIGAMPGTLDLAAAAQLDMARTADIASNVLTTFQIKAEDMIGVADVLALTMSTSNTNIEQLAEAIKFVGPIAGAMGISLKQTAAAIGLLGNAGIQADMAGTGLRMSLAALAKPTGEAMEALSRLGISKSALIDSKGNVKGFVEIVKELERTGANASDMMQIFGVRAGPAMMALLSQGAKKLEDYTATMDDAGGTAKRISDRQLKGFYGQLELLKSVFEELQIVIADSGLLTAVTNFAKALTDILQVLVKTNPDMIRFLLVIAGAAAVFGPLLMILGQTALALTSILNLFKAVAVVIGVSTKAAAIFAGTAAIVVAALAIWAYNIYLIWKNWDAITSAFSSWQMFWKTMMFFFLEIFDTLKGIAKIALPKWLERKIGLSPVEPGLLGTMSAEEAMRSAGGASARTETVSKVKIDFSNLPPGTKFTSEDGTEFDPESGSLLLE